jgi:hypothetical protein
MPGTSSLARWAALALVGLCLLGYAPAEQTREYAVIVHPGTPVAGVSLTSLRRIYLGEQQFWPEGRRVVVFIQPTGSSARELVLRELYRMSEREYAQYWIARIFRDEATNGPRIVASAELMKELTARVPGAIAVIPAGEVDARVKVLRVEGLLPGAGGYPLSRRPR